MLRGPARPSDRGGVARALTGIGTEPFWSAVYRSMIRSLAGGRVGTCYTASRSSAFAESVIKSQGGRGGQLRGAGGRADERRCAFACQREALVLLT